MLIVKQAKDIQDSLIRLGFKGKKIGFVPTMGALHQGHISLINQAKNECDAVIASIFVNPTQFNNPEDFAKYPITINEDVLLLEQAGCTLLYLPNVQDVYPDGIENAKAYIYNLNGLDTHLEGAARPGHFQGVAMVVHRLLNAVQPSDLYMGIKDYQQCMVVRALIENEQINTKLHVCPTLREAHGLAMSSRNRRLSAEAFEKAGVIYQCLLKVKNAQNSASFADVKNECNQALIAQGLEPEYLILAHAYNLEIFKDYIPGEPMVLLIAAYKEGVRLIDNMVITD
jgi:pantoate--beta-alanine ligase